MTTLADLPEEIRRLNPALYNPWPRPPEAKDGKQSNLERDLQRLCEQELTRRGIRWYLHLSFRAREKAGTPDILTLVHGVPWAIELKTVTGRLSEAQKQTLAAMEADGWHTAVIRNYEEFRKVVFGEEREG